jgi:hypothetical protein
MSARSDNDPTPESAEALEQMREATGRLRDQWMKASASNPDEDATKTEPEDPSEK